MKKPKTLTKHVFTIRDNKGKKTKEMIFYSDVHTGQMQDSKGKKITEVKL